MAYCAVECNQSDSGGLRECNQIGIRPVLPSGMAKLGKISKRSFQARWFIKIQNSFVRKPLVVDTPCLQLSKNLIGAHQLNGGQQSQHTRLSKPTEAKSLVNQTTLPAIARPSDDQHDWTDRANHTFRSGKRNEVVDFVIVDLEAAWPFGGDQRKCNALLFLHGLCSQFDFDTAENQFLYRQRFSRTAFAFSSRYSTSGMSTPTRSAPMDRGEGSCAALKHPACISGATG